MPDIYIVFKTRQSKHKQPRKNVIFFLTSNPTGLLFMVSWSVSLCLNMV